MAEQQQNGVPLWKAPETSGAGIASTLALTALTTGQSDPVIITSLIVAGLAIIAFIVVRGLRSLGV